MTLGRELPDAPPAVLVGACGGSDSSSAGTTTPAPPAVTTAPATVTPAATTPATTPASATAVLTLRTATATATASATVAGSATRTATAAGTAVAASGPYDPCKLLDQGQVEEAAGQKMDVGARNGMGVVSPLGQNVCTWASSSVPVRIVQVSVIRQQDFSDQLKNSGYTVERLYNDTKAGMSDAQPVSGVGDEAYRSRTHLYVRKGTVYVQVDVSGGSATTGNETLISLARATLQRLGA